MAAELKINYYLEHMNELIVILIYYLFVVAIAFLNSLICTFNLVLPPSFYLVLNLLAKLIRNQISFSIQKASSVTSLCVCFKSFIIVYFLLYWKESRRVISISEENV